MTKKRGVAGRDPQRGAHYAGVCAGGHCLWRNGAPGGPEHLADGADVLDRIRRCQRDDGCWYGGAGRCCSDHCADNVYPEPAAYHYEHLRVQPDAGAAGCRCVCWPLLALRTKPLPCTPPRPTPRARRGTFFSMALCSYLSWALGSWLGAIATGLLPPLITAALGISLYAMFIGLLMPGLHGNGRLAALVVLTALCNTVLCNVVQLDSGWSMILSTLGCAALGSFFVTPNTAGGRRTAMQNRDIYLMILGMTLVTYLPRVLPALFDGPHQAERAGRTLFAADPLYRHDGAGVSRCV